MMNYIKPNIMAKIKSYTDIKQSKKLAEIIQHKNTNNTHERVIIAGCNLGIPKEKQGKLKPVEIKPHLPNGSIPYDREYEEAQAYISERGFDIPWNDCDVFIDERYITQTIANVLTWADEHPKQKPVSVEHGHINEGFHPLIDEGIRKALIRFFQCFPYENLRDAGLSTKEAIAWLEKQKSVEWSEEDEEILNRLIGVLEQTNTEDYHEGWEELFLPWLESLKKRMEE